MKLKRGALFLVIALTFTLFSLSPLWATPKAKFSIVYTNDVMGEVEPCG